MYSFGQNAQRIFRKTGAGKIMSLKLLEPANRSLIGLAILGIGITGAIAFYTAFDSDTLKQNSIPKVTTPSPIKKITALGRIEPEAGVINIAAPLALDGDRVAQWLVKEGDSVKSGQVIAILDSRDRAQDILQQAQEQVRVAIAQLNRVKAGAKNGEIQAQKAEVVRLQAELSGETAAYQTAIALLQVEVRQAETEYNRYLKLYQQEAVAASILESKSLELETAKARLKEAQTNLQRTANSLKAELTQAKANLDRIVEVRPIDVSAAQIDVDNARASLKRMETELQQAYIRSPLEGQILKIHARTSEKIGEEGIADFGQTERMSVIAEVYHTDIALVRLEQEAIVTSQAFSGQLQGTVSQIGLQVNRQNVFSDRPGENLDRRIIEVKIRLTPEDSKRVRGLTNLQVQVAINTNSD
jgi:HlyD family secretion protein